MTASQHDKPLLLLVDDLPANLHVLVAALRGDYRIKTALNGPAALELATRADPPELILLDVMMPGMSGIEVLKRLRAGATTRDIPVIMVSADTSEQSQLEGLEQGADDYLTKPVVSAILRVRVRNLLQRKRAETQLKLAAHVFEYCGEAILITDKENRILDANPAFTRITGYTLEEVRGRNPRMLASGRTGEGNYRAMWRSIQEHGFWQGELWDRHKDGGVYPKLLTVSVVRNLRGEIEFYIGSFANISEQKAAEERIRHVAHHDPLTQLPNRLHLQASLEQALAVARREGSEVALMFLDLDRFKVINDTLGHNVGDSLLVEVAARLRATLRESDLVARLGGDEFVVVLSGSGAAGTVAHVAEKIVSGLGAPYSIEGNTLHTSPSIGISLYPHDGESIEALMKNADTAMYHAKAVGRNNFQFFSVEMNRAAADRLTLENSLHEAIERGQLLLHYQPQVQAEDGRVIGLEALVRWLHPEHGMVPPDRFIPIAEESGLIVALGDWVLATACRQLRRWRDEGAAGLRLSVNLSLYQLRQGRLVERVAALLAEHRLPPGSLELEITESAAMQDPQATIRQLAELRRIGVDLAIDDFGTGHSSLSYLKLLPIQRLKLDRSFVRDIESDPNDAAICSATVALAHALGLEVVAEGVESAAQHEFLRRLGCGVMQGYLFSRPLPAEELGWLAAGVAPWAAGGILAHGRGAQLRRSAEGVP